LVFAAEPKLGLRDGTKGWCSRRFLPSLYPFIRSFFLTHGNISREEIVEKILSESIGNTGETCRALFRYIGVHRLPILIFEQHSRMLSKAQKYLDEWQWMVNTLTSLGIHADARLFDSKDFKAPTVRYRTYGVAVEFRDIGISQREAVDMVEAILDTVGLISKYAKMSDPPVEPQSSYLLPDTHPTVVNELKTLQATKAKDLEDTASHLMWKQDFATQARKYGMRTSQVSESAELSASPWYQALPAMAQRGLQLHLGGVPAATSIETSQSITHMTVMTEPLFSTLLPTGRIIVREPISKSLRCVVSTELLSVAGIPSGILEHFRKVTGYEHSIDKLFTDLAGNAFQAEILGAFQISVLIHLKEQHLDFMQRHRHPYHHACCSRSLPLL
jgi:site-specific DNA-cytosine methylase